MDAVPHRQQRSHHAPGLGAALEDVQDAVAPEDPGDDEPPEREGQDDGRGGGVGQRDHVDEHAGAAQLAAHADVEVREPGLHLGALAPA